MNINKDIYIEIQKEKINTLVDENTVLQTLLIEKTHYITELENKINELENTEQETKDDKEKENEK